MVERTCNHCSFVQVKHYVPHAKDHVSSEGSATHRTARRRGRSILGTEQGNRVPSQCHLNEGTRFPNSKPQIEQPFKLEPHRTAKKKNLIQLHSQNWMKIVLNLRGN